MLNLNKLKTMFGCVALGAAVSLSAPVYAANDAMMDLLKILRDKGSISAEEYDLLANASKADKEKVEGVANELNAKVDKATKKLPKITTKGKLQIASQDGNHKWRIGGRMHYDTTLVNGDTGYSGTSETQFRRARLYLRGTTFKVWDYKFQFDFEDADDTGQAIEDFYIKYKGLPVAITLGQRKSAYGFTELASSNNMPFIERSFASNFFNSTTIGLSNRAPGVTLSYKKSNVLLEGGYYFLRTPGGGERDLDDGQGATGRIAYGNYDKKAKTLFHAGVAGGYRNYGSGGVGRVRVRPGVSEGDRIVDTDAGLAADSYTSFALELAGIYKQFWGAAEYFHGSFDLNNTPGDDEADGYYVEAGMFLTDDARTYKTGAGSWGSVKPKSPVGKGGFGAWEVALRYDHLKIGDALHGGASDEEGETFGVALNWYPINNLRFQANYITTFCDGSCDFGNAEPNFFVFRTKLSF